MTSKDVQAKANFESCLMHDLKEEVGKV